MNFLVSNKRDVRYETEDVNGYELEYYSNAGKYLKAKSGWNEGGNGTDEFGFSALPGGYGSSGGNFTSVGDGGYWWSATEYLSDYAYYRGMYYNGSDVGRNHNYESDLLSVRCVQD